MARDNIKLQVRNTEVYARTPKSSSERLLEDDVQLRRLGKRPLLKRSFGFMSILGFSCSALISWEGILVTSVGGLVNGGPAGVIWGFLLNWIGMLSTFAVLAELSSMAPTAGGQYHWVAMMAPQSYRNFLAYLTGWLTTLAWQTACASTGYLIATIIQGLVVMSRPSYAPEAWHTILLMWAVMSFAVAINSTTSQILAKFEGLVLILHLVGFFCVLIPLVYFGPHGKPSTVFTTFINGGGWSSQSVSFFVGLPASAASLVGGDSAVHMSEEIQSAATVVPQALMWTVIINGTLAWAMVFAMMFCAGDLSAALEAQKTMFYPFLEIILQAVKSKGTACALVSITVVMAIASGVGLYASASRMIWSFSRDRGLPFHSHLVKLSKNSLPVTAIFVTLAITMVLSLVSLSAVAFSALTSLAVAALYSSYLIVSVLLLWCRLTGRIKREEVTDSIDLNSDRLLWGPWRVSEPWGSMNNLFACIYLSFIFFWSFWPPVTPTTPQTANYAVLVFGTVAVFSIVWYFVSARHTFKGPVREVELDFLSR